jgi:hypothetical protein
MYAEWVYLLSKSKVENPKSKVRCPWGDCEQLEVGKEGMPPLFVAKVQS